MSENAMTEPSAAYQRIADRQAEELARHERHPVGTDPTGTPHRAYIFLGFDAKHRDFPSEAAADAAVAEVKARGDGWDGWTEPLAADELEAYLARTAGEPC